MNAVIQGGTWVTYYFISIKVLEEKLYKISKELAYCYGNYRIAQRECNDLEQQRDRIKESRSFYEQEMHKERKKVKDLVLENKKLLEIINEIS